MSPRDALEEGPVQKTRHGWGVAPELVLTLQKVHPVLGPHAGIHVGEEGGGNPNVGGASPVERRGEPHDVQAHAPADGDDGLRAPVQAEALDLVQDVQHQVHGFCFLGGWQGKDFVLDVVLFKVFSDFGAVKFVNDFVNDDEAPQFPLAGHSQLCLLGVSDVTPEQSGVRGLQDVVCFYHFVAKIDGSFNDPGNPTFGDALTSGKDQKTWFEITIYSWLDLCMSELV